jgi:hypothetical protein
MGNATRVKFLQTADPTKYARLLEASAPSTRAFCAINGYEYEAHIGIKRGRRAWHATFNRIDLLNEALGAGFDGWIVYLDADSFVVDLHFDLRSYLQQHASAPLIARAVIPDKAPTWNINAGVLMCNMRHPQTARLIRTWKRLFDLWCGAGLLLLPPRLAPLNDQILLHWALRLNPDIIRAVRFEHPDFINGALASFIVQFLRADVEDFDLRVSLVAERVRQAFAASGIDPALYSAAASRGGTSRVTSARS